MTDEQKRKAAARARKCRERRKYGYKVLPVPVDFIAVTEKLCEAGYLDACRVEDPKAAASAIAAYLHAVDEYD